MPEKSASEIPRPLRDQWDKGKSVMTQGNLDYAMTIFAGVLQKEPAFYACRESLRQTQLKKAGAGGSGFFKKMIGTASSSPMLAKAQIQIRSNPIEAIATLEQILNGDPRNYHAHKALAEAALAADMPKTAVMSLEIIRAGDPRDKAVSTKLVEAYSVAGDFAKAEAVFADLTRQYPNDPELAMACKNLSAKRTLNEKGYEQLASGGGSYRDVLKDKEEAQTLEQSSRQVQDDNSAERLIHEFEQRLAQEPTNLKLARSVAELYAQRHDHGRALEYYRYILGCQGGADAAIEKVISELTIKQIETETAALDSAAPDFEARKAEIESRRRAFKLDDVKKRAEKYPTDLQIKFELGVLYYESGQITEAIQEFQKAQANQNKRIAAMNYLGLCFAAGGKYEMAARKMAEAIKEKPVFDEEKKDLVYNYGCVLEKLGKRDEAVKQFELIYQEDIGYRDVAAKVDGYYSSGGGTATKG